jgi:endonuclease YncB( thermonuclease family)
MIDVMIRLLSLALLVLAMATTALADVTGPPLVTGGDTIVVSGERIRLDAIDAPESRQICRTDGQSWRCGLDAALALARRIGIREVTCTDRGTDQDERILAICYIGDLDLNGWLVSEGWALAYRQYSTEYVTQEAAARAARRGLWRGEFVPPWEWREGERRD